MSSIEPAATAARTAGPPVIEIDDLHKSFGGIEVLRGVSVMARQGQVMALLKELNLDDNTLAAMYGVTGFPTYVLIDHEGAVRARKAGWSQDIDQWLEREIDKLLKAIPNGSD